MKRTEAHQPHPDWPLDRRSEKQSRLRRKAWKTNAPRSGTLRTTLRVVVLAMALWPCGVAAQIQSLKQAYAGSFELGAAIPGVGFSPDDESLLGMHFTNITPENCMKPGIVAKVQGQFDFSEADALMELARRHGLKVNGHTLVWHQRCPDWFFLEDGQTASRETALERMRNHIATVAGRYAGRIATWDVVNEAIVDGPGYLRESKWLATIGDDYVAQAFLAAHKADPAARLYYNDYQIEAGAKREKALRLIRELKAKGIPVHGIGIQGHWQLDSVPYKEIADAIDLFHAEGLEVAITELDIDVVTRKTTGADSAHKEAPRKDPFPNELPPEIAQRLAEQYARLFTLLHSKSDKLVRVTFWGLHDGRSWLNHWPTVRTNHPLLWDRQLQPKPAYHAVIEAARTTKKEFVTF